MLDIKYIRENSQLVKDGALAKGIDLDIDELLEVDKKLSVLLVARQKLQEERNKAAKEKNIEKGKEIKIELEKIEDEFGPLSIRFNELMLLVPNLPKDDVKIGKNDKENDVIRKEGEPTKFDFNPKDHLDLGEWLEIIDVKRAAKVSGARFDYLIGNGALLEYALFNLASEILLKEGFIPIIPPVLIKTEIMKGLGYMENGGDQDMFHISNDGLTLIGTAEHALVPFYKDEVLQKKDLPKRYFAYTPAFRRESGSYGKDTRGILRVHEFNKVEMVSFVSEGEDDKEHEHLLSIEEKFFKLLGIPYQVVKMCTGDLGFPAARKYDIEAWMPGENKYREVTSVSTVTDFQSRRLNMRYQDGNEKKYLQVLNGTAFSMNRPIIAILENYQEEDGSVRIPEVLQKYMGGLKKIERK